MTDAPLIPIQFTYALDRFRHAPGFSSLVPSVTYGVTSVGYEGLERFSEGQGQTFAKKVDDRLPVKIWNGEDLTGCRVAYHANGRHGDELIHTSVWRQLQKDYPGIDLHHYALSHDTENFRISSYNRDIGGTPHRAGFAFSREQLSHYDCWIIPPNVGHVYRGESEKTQYELLEDHLGITIEQKRPFVWLPGGEKETVRALLMESLGRTVEREYVPGIVSSMLEDGSIIVQINASEECRTPSPRVWVEILRGIRKERGELIVVCGDEQDVTNLFAFGADKIPGIVPLSNRPLSGRPHVSSHGILHMVAVARLILAPDSFLMHASAAFDVPCLALWQRDPEIIKAERVPSPESRVKHYDNVEAYDMTDADGVVVRSLEILNGGTQ